MVFQDGVTGDVQHVTVLIILKALGTQCYTLIQRDMIADDSRFANYHTRTMVDSKVLAYRSSWMCRGMFSMLPFSSYLKLLAPSVTP